MKHLSRLLPPAVLLLTSSAGLALEKMEQRKIEGAGANLALRTQFGTYGYRPQQSLRVEADGLRFWLPAGVAQVGQTGFYSYFVLAGDCEASCAYELRNLQPPRGGYGSGVGLAFDAGDEVGRCVIQRVHKTPEGAGYALNVHLIGADGKASDENRFVPTKAKRGRIGLKRVKKELIFLASDDPGTEGKEIDRLTFTDRTIRAVRLFADPGGSPTAIDARVNKIDVRAEQITGGVPEKEKPRTQWWWLAAFPAIGAGVLVWRWRRRR